MPHIDEGLLEAWLDRDRSGLAPDEATTIESHLADCAECRARLEMARGIRDRVDAILAGSGPADLVLPDFGVIAARAAEASRDGVGAVTPAEDDEAAPDPIALPMHDAERGRWTGPAPAPVPPPVMVPPSAAPGWRRRLVATAWAASILGAIGLGWLGREMSAPERLASVDQAEEAVVLAESRPADVPGPGAGAASTSSPPPLPPAVEPASAYGPVVAGAPSVPDLPEPVSAADRAMTEASIPLESVVPTGLPSAREVNPEPDPVAAVALGERQVAPMAARSAAPSTEAVAESVMGAEPTGVATARVADSAAPAAPPIAAAITDDLAAFNAWVPAELAAAAARLGSVVALIDGRPVETVEIAADTGVRAVRVVQTLADGAPVHIVQWVGVEPVPAGAAAPDGFETLTLRRDGIIITVSAPIPADQLGSLPLTPP